MTDLIAIAGAGRMGTALALKLAAGGAKVLVLPPRSGLPSALQGFDTAKDAAELAARADVVLTTLRDGAQTAALLPALLEGAKGKPGFLHVDHGNGDPAQARAAAAAWAAQDQLYADAPLLGPPEVIATHMVRLLVGAEPGAFARLKQISTPYSASAVHAGAPGQGHFLRMVLNQLGYGMVALSAEVIATGRAGGLAPEVMRDAASGMGLDSGTFQTLLASAIDPATPDRPLSLAYMNAQLAGLGAALPAGAPSERMLAAICGLFEAAGGPEPEAVMATSLPARLQAAPLRGARST